MALPEQIKKQSEAVQRLYEELNSDGEEPEVQEDEPTEAAEPVAEESVSSEPTAQSEKQVVESEDEETFAQKYRSLQGMYNTQVPRLQSENKQLKERLDKMENLLGTMQQPTQPTQPEQTQAEIQRLVSEKEVEEYGEDTVDMFRRLSREEYMPVMQKLASFENTLKQLQDTVVPKVENVERTQARTAEERFWESLERSVPDWREINANQDFHTWLLEYDPLIGNTRQSLLEQAQSSMDASRVVHFFNTWKSSAQGKSGKASPNPASSELEKQVAPGRARAASSKSGSEARTYTPDDIRKFFEDVRKGVYKDREEERNRIERDIFAAQQQGRIVVNG